MKIAVKNSGATALNKNSCSTNEMRSCNFCSRCEKNLGNFHQREIFLCKARMLLEIVLIMSVRIYKMIKLD
jgi:hypothetical protein